MELKGIIMEKSTQKPLLISEIIIVIMPASVSYPLVTLRSHKF